MSNPNLVSKVKAVNSANATAKVMYEKLAAVFRPFIGQKVFKADGSLLEKFRKMLPEIPSGNRMHVYKMMSAYSLAWCAKACEPVIQPHGESYGVNYYEAGVYVGSVRGGVLTEICNAPNVRSDYTVEEVEGLLAAAEKAREAARNAESACGPFNGRF